MFAGSLKGLRRPPMVERKARDHRVERDGVRALEGLLDHVGHEERGRHLTHAD